MLFCFDPELVGISSLKPKECITVASDAGFAGVSINPVAVVALSEDEKKELAAFFKEKQLFLAPWEFTFDWRRNERYFQQGLTKLAEYADAMAVFGPSTIKTWIAPFSMEFDWNENMKHHVKQLRAMADTLASRGEGMKLALKFVGSRKIRKGFRYEFLHNLNGLRTLCRSIRKENVGIVLESWSIKAAGDPFSVIDHMEGSEIFVVQISDGPEPFSLPELEEDDRFIPETHNTIDNQVFVSKVTEIGFNGPFLVEFQAGNALNWPVEEKAEKIVACMWNSLLAPQE